MVGVLKFMVLFKVYKKGKIKLYMGEVEFFLEQKVR